VKRSEDLGWQLLQALDDPAAVITLSIMRYRGMPAEMAALEKPVLEFLSEHSESEGEGTWPAKALEAYRASSSGDPRITDAHFQHLFDWACMDWPPLSPLALAIWIGQHHEIPVENIEQAIKLLFPGATEQQRRGAKSEVAQVWRNRLLVGPNGIVSNL
jgi:hypothetical protein